MKEIIKALFMKGYKAKDILAVTRYINENYDIIEGDVVHFQSRAKRLEAKKNMDDACEKAKEVIMNNADRCNILPNGSIIGPADAVTNLENAKKNSKDSIKKYHDANNEVEQIENKLNDRVDSNGQK